MIVGLDVGASLIKGILVDDDLNIVRGCVLPAERPEINSIKVLDFLLEGSKDYKSAITCIAASGGGSRFLSGEILGLAVRRVDEIRAVGLGGLALANRDKGLIVSAGTGTAIVAAYRSGGIVKHVCGTAVGGGTIVGLSRRILGVSDFKVLEDMASKGNPNNVDLMVGDIVGGPIGMVPADATASNLGKLSCKSSVEDVAAGIFNMVSQTIGVIAAMAAKAYRLEDSVILVGMLAKSKIFSRITCETAKLFGAEVLVPKNCEFAGALGAAISILWEERSRGFRIYGRGRGYPRR
ncbi:MAG: Fumble domain-containing protein [Candidatus Bathyarchaeia archaeon]